MSVDLIARAMAASAGKSGGGVGITVKGFYATLEALKAAVTDPESGDAYGVGSAAPYDIYIYDGASSDWVNSGKLKGEDGISPAVTVTEIEGGHQVKITDKDHPSGQTFDVMNGEDGASDAGEVTYDSSETYADGTVGKAVQDNAEDISTLSATKQKKIYDEEPEDPVEGDLWIDRDDHTGNVPNPDAGLVSYERGGGYPENSIGGAANSLFSAIVNLSASIAEDYDAAASYSDGDYAMFDGVLKKYNGTAWNAVRITDLI